MSKANVIALSQPGNFTDLLTEVLRLIWQLPPPKALIGALAPNRRRAAHESRHRRARTLSKRQRYVISSAIREPHTKKCRSAGRRSTGQAYN